MNKKYFTQFKNENLERLLLDKENILPLEELMHSQLEKLGGIIQNKPKPDRKLNSKEFYDLIPQLKEDVDQFLDIDEAGCPLILYLNRQTCLKDCFESLLLSLDHKSSSQDISSESLKLYCSDMKSVGVWNKIRAAPILMRFVRLSRVLDLDNIIRAYFPRIQFITMTKEKMPKVIPIMGHEYGHYLQHQAFLKRAYLSQDYNIFKEGHARGVERYIADIYNKREDDQRFLEDRASGDYIELKQTYKWLCQELDISPNTNLVGITLPENNIQAEQGLEQEKPSEHSLGNTLFYLHETKKGKQIYKDVINGTFEFK